MNLPHLEPCEHELPPSEFGTLSQLMADTGHGDAPIVVMLTCWELGTAPDQVSFANPGEIMVAQSPGGLVPSVETHEPGSYLGTVLYGLNHSTVGHLIVCGHTECKTLGLLLEAESKKKKNPFHHLMENVKERFRVTYADRPARDWLSIVVQESVLQQLANLRSHTSVESRLRDGTLLMHGWIRDDDSSAIAAYNPTAGQFCD